MLKKIATQLGKGIIMNEIDKRLTDVQKSIASDLIDLISKK